MDVIAAKLVALVFSFLILGNAFAVRRVVGTWLFPACIFSLFWFGYTFLPLAVLFYEPVSPWAVGYIFCGMAAFSMGSLVYFRWRPAFDLNRRKPEVETYFNTPFVRTVFYVASVFSLVLFVLGMRIEGFSVSDMLFNSIDTAAQYAGLRNAEALSNNLIGKLGMALAYLAATTGGLLFGSSTSRRQSLIVLVSAFAPAIAPLLFQSAKGLLFQFIFLFLGSILVTRLFQGRLYLLDAPGIRRGVLALAVVFPMTVLSFFSRGLRSVVDPTAQMQLLMSYFASYAFGHLYAFSDWFSFRVGLPSLISYPIEPNGYGFYTFTPLFKLFGSTRTFPPGLYDDYFTSGDLLRTNIFSMFRGLIIDFGMLGTILFMFLSGAAIHIAYYFLLVRPRPTVSVAIFIYSVGYFYSSALSSLFIYNVIPASIVVLSVVLYTNRLVHQR
jgi:oligosaccharide repeat unit polymerase